MNQFVRATFLTAGLAVIACSGSTNPPPPAKAAPVAENSEKGSEPEATPAKPAAPVGLAVMFWHKSNGGLFLILYGFVSYYFAQKMNYFYESDNM